MHHTKRLELAGIPALHVSPAGLQGPAPTVILYHGWVGRKENQLDVAELLAGRGISTLLPDLPHHGERDAFADYNAPESWALFWEIVIQAILEVDALRAAAVAQGLAAPDRIGVVGSSAGGMVAAGAMGRYPWVRAAALLNGCPCFDWLDQVAPGPGSPKGEALARLRAFDPEAHIAQMAPRPLLLLHGAADTTLPVEGVRRFAAAARPLYAEQPENLVLTEYPRLNHWVTIGMVSTMRDWFVRHLA